MIISVKRLSHHFNFNYLFKDVSIEIEAGKPLAVLGANGTGKSTFLKLLLGQINAVEGEIKYTNQSDVVDVDSIVSKIALCSPAMELIEDFTLEEQLKFHFSLRPLREDVSIESIIEVLDFKKQKDKQLKHFSSGMLQRLKLALVFYSDVEVCLFDEPLSNLDERWMKWYHSEVEQIKDRLIIVASNDPREYSFCTEQLELKK